MISSVHWLAGLATLLLSLTVGSAFAQVSTVCTFTAGAKSCRSLKVRQPCEDSRPTRR